ncbi:16S rRNA (uracil(1498)-N(3))-methyltransferase [soil metagenome]
MSLARFYIAPASWHAETLVLEGDEANHCSSVMRHHAGDEIVVFNGAGDWARTRITSASPKRVELETLSADRTPKSATTLTLLQAIPKGSSMELIIEKSVELGVNVIMPVMTERTVVKLDSKDAAKKQVKWQRLAVEACKQCGQNWLPEVQTPQSFYKALEKLPTQELRIIAAIQDDAMPLKGILADQFQIDQHKPASVMLCIGPEGDFTPAEYAAAREKGCLPMTLGSIIMRVETAAMYGLSVLSHELRT